MISAIAANRDGCGPDGRRASPAGFPRIRTDSTLARGRSRAVEVVIRSVAVTAAAVVVAAAGRTSPAFAQPPAAEEAGHPAASAWATPLGNHQPSGVDINPDWLFQVAPDDPDAVDTQTTLQLCLKGNPNTLNPILMTTGPESRVRELLFDSLVVFDRRLQWSVNETMVESYEFASDMKSARFRLKRGLRWHDGRPLTAHDVVFSWKQILDPRVPIRAARSGTDQISDCRAIDDRTIRFEFAQALPTNRWNVMFPLIPKHVYEQGKADDPTLTKSTYFNRVNREPIGNGPFRFVRWRADERIVLERWPDYPGALPRYRRVVFNIVPNPATRMSMFEQGLIEEFEMTPRQFARESESSAFKKVGVRGRANMWKYIYIAWNMDGSNPFFADRLVRRAMNHAIDYDLIIRQVYEGAYARSYGIYQPGHPAFDSGLVLFDHDLVRASALLDQAGWRRSEEDGWRYKTVTKNGRSTNTRFAFTLNVPRESATSPSVAAIIKNDLRRIGVDMEIRVIEWAAFVKLSRAHEFQAMISAWTAGKDPDDEWNLWHSSAYDGGRNYVGYANPKVDALYKSARRCFDEDRRRSYYRQISRIIYDDAPYAFVAGVPALWAINRRVRGVTFSPRGPFHFHPGIRAWWVPKIEAADR